MLASVSEIGLISCLVTDDRDLSRIGGKMKDSNKLSVRVLLAGTLLLTCIFFMTCPPDAIANERGHKGKQAGKSIFSTSKHGEGDKGNEFTGELTAWIFAAANFPALLSLLVRGLIRNTAMAESLQDHLKRFNQTQKKSLMPFHYILNSLALLLAFIHFSLSHCRSSSLPEWGLTVMVTLAVMGMTLKFKVVPKSIRRTVYRVHTNPLPAGLLVIFLLIGHSIID